MVLITSVINNLFNLSLMLEAKSYPVAGLARPIRAAAIKSLGRN